MDEQTKQYLEILIGGVRGDITSLSNRVDNLSSKVGDLQAQIHTLELSMSTEIARIKADVNSVFDKVRGIENDLVKEEGVRQESDISLAKRLADSENEQAKRWKEHDKDSQVFTNNQGIENDRNGGTRKLLYLIGTTVLLLLINFIWSVITAGGIGNLP